MAIRNYHDRRTAAFVQGERVPDFEQCRKQAIKAIAKLQAATRLIELRNLPSNHFEALGGRREGQFSIRINDKWRVCFRWAFTEPTPEEGADPLMVQGEPYDVEITNHYGG
jgi:proteic killer suppression protein